MSRFRVLFHIARADFLERVRRYSFLLTMIFSLYLGYAIYAGQVNLQLDRYRGVANSAWLGSVVGLFASVFLSLIGFYVVKNTIQRDRETRVGRILAATPLSRSLYTLGKALSNFAVLGLMILILAAEAVVIQWIRGGMGSVHLFDLLAPVLAFGLCSVSVTAALAVLFEAIPGLRSGGRKYRLFFPLVLPAEHERHPACVGKAPRQPGYRERLHGHYQHLGADAGPRFIGLIPSTKADPRSASDHSIVLRRPSSGWG